MARSIETRTLLGSALAAVMVGAGFLAVGRFMARTSAVTAERRSLDRAVRALDRELSALKDAETGQRGFLLTGQAAYLTPYDEGRAAAREGLDTLAADPNLDPAAWRRLEALTRAKLEELDRTVALAKGGHRTEAIAMVEGGEGLRRMDEIRGLEAAMVQDLEGRRDARAASLAEESRRLRAALAATGLLTFASLGAGAWILARDGRQRRAREQALAASEQRLQLLMDGIQDYALLFLDPQGRVSLWNQGAQRLKGYTAGEILGSSAARFYPPESAGRFELLLAEARERGRVEDEGHRVRKDGSRFWADVVITAIRDAQGHLLGFAKITRDLTERRQAMEELRASEQRFRALAETAPIGIYEYDFARGTVYANSTHCDLSGLPRGTISRERFRDSVHPEDRPRVLGQVESAMAGGLPLDETYRLRHADGRVLWVRSLGAPLAGAGGRPSGYLFVTQDITAALAAEAEIRDKAEALEAANRELEAFAYSVSHDLRAPLRHIDGFVGLLRKSLGPGVDARSAHQLDIISDSARQMGTLIDDLLSFSRMGRAEVHQADFDLGDLARSVAQELAPDAAGREVEWTFGPLPRVHADPALIRLALLNLAGNALKFTRGKVPARIAFSAARSGDQAAITLRDNGVGFDMQYADKLFSVFQRLHRQDEFEGTGIGLANVARIIHKHGGTISAEAVPGEGAAFTFTLPLAPEAPWPA